MSLTESQIEKTRPDNRSFIVIGLLITLGGLVWLGKTASFVHRAEKVPAVVLRTEIHQTKHNVAEYPVFRFTEPSGLVRTQRSSAGVGFWKTRPGAQVVILYDPAAPEKAEINSFVDLWLGPLAMIPAGLIFAGAAFSPRLRQFITSGRKQRGPITLSSQQRDG